MAARTPTVAPELPRATVRRAASGAERVPWALGAAAVAAQVAYPLVRGPARDGLTVAIVCLTFAAVATHVAGRYGARVAAAFLGTALAAAFLAEVVGVRTGYPFGDYSYGDSLGPHLLGVPLVVPCAWVMTAYPALIVGRHLARGRLRVALVSGWALASWDVFLDPQMVAAGHWRWLDPSPALPGSPGVPLSNYAGWLAVSLVLMAVLDRVLPAAGAAHAATERRADLLPGALYLWTYASQVLANAAFFGRPAVALLGGALMGLTAIPYAAALARRHE